VARIAESAGAPQARGLMLWFGFMLRRPGAARPWTCAPFRGWIWPPSPP